MKTPVPGPVCALYVPGDRPDRFEKAARSGADQVVIDLEDAVAPDGKAQARINSAEYLGSPNRVMTAVVLRINGVDTEHFEADMILLHQLAAHGHLPAEVRLPKVESADEVAILAAIPGLAVAALIESALGLEAATDIASARGVVSIGLGEADLRSELMLESEDSLAYARSRVVVAAAAAGLRSPAMAAYPNLEDVQGLASSCQLGRTLGCYGRSAVHPHQIPVIRDAFRPTIDEVTAAREILRSLDAGLEAGRGVVRNASGAMVDAAMRRRAEILLARAVEFAPSPEFG